MTNLVSKYIQVHVASYDSTRHEYSYLVLQRADNLAIYPSIWQVITGTLLENESAIEASIREIFEEIGLVPEKMWTIPYIAKFFNPNENTINFSPVFGVLIDSTQDVKLSYEHQKYEWLKYYDCIDKLVLPSHKEGTRVFWEYILSKKDKTMFQIDSNIINEFLINMK